MSTSCLNDVEIRAAADGEAAAPVRAHATSCAQCRARVAAAVAAIMELRTMAASVPVPPDLGARLERALARSPGDRAETTAVGRGSTTLRPAPAGRPWLRPAWVSGLVLAAAVVTFVFFAPFANAPATLSAAEILGRSLERWAPAAGTELLEFDLTVEVPAIAGIESGTYRIEQLIDHDTPGRHRMTRYAPGGAMIGAFSEDAAAGRRTVLVPTDSGMFAFRFAIDPQHGVSLRDIERHHVQAMLRILQTMASDTVTEGGGGAARRYVVNLPPVASAGGQTLWQLATARVVIDAATFDVLEADASGNYMGDPFSLSFRLRRREVRPSAAVPAREFEVPATADAMVIESAGTANVPSDLFKSALNELARLKAR